MKRMRGITHADFIRAYGFPEDSPDNISWRKNLIEDIAQYVSILAIADLRCLLFVAFWLCPGNLLRQSASTSAAV